MKKVHENKEKKKKETRKHGDEPHQRPDDECSEDSGEDDVNLYEEFYCCCKLKIWMYCLVAVFFFLSIISFGVGGYFHHEDKPLNEYFFCTLASEAFLFSASVWCMVEFGHGFFWFTFFSLGPVSFICVVIYVFIRTPFVIESERGEIQVVKASEAFRNLLIFTLLLIWTMAAAAFAFWRFRRSDWKRFEENCATGKHHLEEV